MNTTESRPLTLTPAQVCAALDGRLTQVRMPIEPQPEEFVPQGGLGFIKAWRWAGDGSQLRAGDPLEWLLNNKCPYGIVGDRLWVREKFALGVDAPKIKIAYAADDKCYGVGHDGNGGYIRIFHGFLCPSKLRGDQIGGSLGRSLYRPWKPPQHMKEWASRITLELTGVRVENDGEKWVWVLDVKRVGQ